MSATESGARPAVRRPDARFWVALMIWAAGAGWYAFVCDDAYISFRYARNLIDGHGLVFNPGLPPVEGFSNPLWVLMVAAAMAVGVPPEWASWAISSACAVGVLALVWEQSRWNGDRSAATAWVTIGLAAFPPFAVWSTGGLETMAVTLAVFATFVAVRRGEVGYAATAAAALALLRPEGVAWVGLAAGVAAIVNADGRRAAGAAVASGLAFAAAWMAFRLNYYHEWVPNTVRVKGDVDPAAMLRGARYVTSYVVSFPAVALACAVAARGRWEGWRVGLVAAAFPAEAILVGGDFMTMGRLLVPALPFGALSVASGLSRVESPLLSRLIPLVLVAASPALVGVNLAPPGIRKALHFRHNEDAPRNEYAVWQGQARNAELWLREGKALASLASPGDAVVSVAIGALGYGSDLTVWDACGLVDPEVAARPVRHFGLHSPGHDKCVPETFFLGRSPEFLAAHWRELDASPVRAGTPRGYVRETHRLTVDGVSGTLTVVRRDHTGSP